MNQPVRIVNKMNGKCITVSQGQFKTKYGDLIVQSYTKSSFQHFLIHQAGQKYTIQSLGDPFLYIDVPGESKDIYEQIITYKYNGNKNQCFNIIKTVQNLYYLVSCHSNLVLEIMGGIDAEGVKVVQNADYKNLNQLWTIENL